MLFSGGQKTESQALEKKLTKSGRYASSKFEIITTTSWGLVIKNNLTEINKKIALLALKQYKKQRKHYFKTRLLNKCKSKSSPILSYKLSTVSLSSLSHLSHDVTIERFGCWCTNVVCVCVCVSPLWPRLACQGVLFRVAVSSIHICASAQRLNMCHQAKSNTECKKQKVCVCVCHNNNLHKKHRHSVV